MRTHARNGNRRGTKPRAKHSARGAGELECMSGHARGKMHQTKPGRSLITRFLVPLITERLNILAFPASVARDFLPRILPR